MNKPPLPAASTVVVYVRDSTEQQGEEEIPIDGQVSELTAAAQDYGWNIYDVIRDVASGTSDKRPGFQRILTLAKSRTPPFEAVFVWKLSRFARNRDDSVIHKALLRKRGIKVLSYKENIPDGPIGRLIEGVIEAVDEFYTANVAEDTLRGLKEVARQGYHPGGRAPVGYVNDRVQVGTKRNGEPLFRTRWQLDAQKASLVRQAFEMAAAGNTFDDIIQATDVCVNKSSLSSILRNRAYIGSRVYNRERQAGSKAVRRRNDESDVVVVEHSHPAIVPREVFEQVQSRLRKYRSPVERQKRRHSPRLLSGLLVCALHNEPYTLTTTHRAYYQCRLRNRRGKKACDNALLDAKLVDKAIPDHLAQQLMVPANVDTILQMVQDEVAAQQGHINDRLLELTQRETKLRRSADNLLEAIAAGTPASMVNPKLGLIKEELDQLAIQKARLQEERPRRTISVTKDDVLDALREIDRLISNAEPEEVASLARGLIEKIVVDGDTLTVHHAFNEREESDLVVQLWLPGQDSNLQPSG